MKPAYRMINLQWTYVLKKNVVPKTTTTALFKRMHNLHSVCILQTYLKTQLHQNIQPHQNIHQNIQTQLLNFSKAFCHSSKTEPDSLVDSILDTDEPPRNVDRKNELLKITEFLLSKGISASDIKGKYKKYISTQTSSYYKAVLIADLHPNVEMLIPLMSLSLVSLRMAAKQARDDGSEIRGFPNRIDYLCHHFKASLEDLIPALAKHSSLLTMPFSRLEHKMTILEDAQIGPEYILKDLWIFNYNEKSLIDRVKAAKKADVELRPWMLRSSKNIFDGMLVKNSETLRILNGEDEVSYLARKLDCSTEYVEYMMEVNKTLKSVNIPKMEQMLNFLFDKGYTPQEIRLFPRVFCSSIQTISKRFEDFKQIRSTLPTMSQLCISDKKFQNKAKQNE